MPHRITRDAFLYMESTDPEFAQCSACRVFVPKQYRNGRDGCVFHGSKVTVDEDMSCGLFTPWPLGKPDLKVVLTHAKELNAGLKPAVTPEESGLVDRQVRCENCFYGGEMCMLFETLNATLPHLFDLDPKIQKRSCCNAQTPKQ